MKPGSWLAKAAYKAAKKCSKRTVWLAKQDFSKSEYANVNPNGPEIHRLAKQMCRQNQDVCGYTLVVFSGKQPS